MARLDRRAVLSGVAALAALGVGVNVLRRSGTGAPDATPLGPWMAPEALAARLAEVQSGKLVVLYVGPHALFGRGHVPGAREVGEAGTEEGLAALQLALRDIPASTDVVLYCGCCPVRSCPNVRPASAALKASGRNNAYMLDLPTRFATDWAEHGYPVARSEVKVGNHER